MEVSLARLLLRLGLAFTLVYAATASLLQPVNWVGFVPSFVRQLGVQESFLLQGFSGLEIVLALWLLWGRKLALPSLAAAGLFLGIALFNLGAMDIVFRDIGLFFAALALAKLSKQP